MIEINNKTRKKVNTALLKRVVGRFSAQYEISDSPVSIALVGDRTMRKLNKKWRAVDKVTDVLAWRNKESRVLPGEDGLGEIVIDYAQICRQAKKFGNTEEEELVFILVHGLLHLIGYDDQTAKEREAMIKMGKDFIKKM